MLLSNRSSQYQNQYTLVNRDGKLRLEIFFFCLPSDVVDPNPAHAPLLLCAVCQQWRRIALTTPKLWNSIYFDCDRWAIFVPKSGAEEAALYVELFRDWIARVRSTPLSLQLYANVYDGAGFSG
ncbi:hypothetical protein B0H14DRAFT_3883696 [Mycena olivaceomarginata]|nr:hypothetical protein B0H14DRAFT_3883696 [Mycena olivaceomarginata]